MRTVLVVDDEILVRIGIRSLLDWEGNGYALVGEAADGAEAFELATRLEPDLVLTDLVMPGTDGLTLIRKLREAGCSSAVIVLSCHNEFDRVREAMRLGACDYLFKPTLKPGELLEAFERIMADRPERHGRTVSGSVSALSLSVLSGTAGTRSGQGKPSDGEAYDRPFRIIAVRFSGAEGEPGTELLEQFAREVARTDDTIIDTAAHRHTAFFSVKNDGRPGLAETFSKIAEFAGRYLGAGPAGGISSFGRGHEAVPCLLDEASRAADRCFPSGKAPVFFEDPVMSVLPRPEDLAKACAGLRGAVLTGDGDAVTRAAEAVFALVRSSEGVSPDRLRRFLADAFAPFRERSRALGFDLEDIDTGSTPDAAVSAAPTIAWIETWFPRFLTIFLAEASRRGAVRPEIAGVISWVLRDLKGQFTVEEAALRARMSASHFAHVFREETGWSFIEFVNRSRMERARELLLSTDLRVYEVASGVGFENANYFSSMYRRLMGCTPQETRDARRAGTGSAGES